MSLSTAFSEAANIHKLLELGRMGAYEAQQALLGLNKMYNVGFDTDLGKLHDICTAGQAKAVYDKMAEEDNDGYDSSDDYEDS